MLFDVKRTLVFSEKKIYKKCNRANQTGRSPDNSDENFICLLTGVPCRTQIPSERIKRIVDYL